MRIKKDGRQGIIIINNKIKKMKNIDKTTLIELDNSELKNLYGGNEITDAFWYGVGWMEGYTRRAWEIVTADPHNSRFR